ncbi:MAG: adenylate/guanylate cyclase domain-containing protein, partial [Planctomycetota bacterium]
IQQANRMRNLRREALENGVRFRVGVGIARGDAVVGFLGSHLRLSFTAIGTTVNLASRLEGATKEVPDAHILVNDAVALDPLVAADIAMAPVPPVDLKGIGPTPVWSVLGKNARKPSS